MAATRKQIVAIVSKSDGTYIKTWPQLELQGFSKEVNGGPGECVLALPLAFDYAGSDVSYGNDVELRVSDVDTMAAKAPGDPTVTIYRGYISLVERNVDGANEKLVVHLLGYYTRLGTDILKNGTQTTLYSRSTTGLTVTAGDQDAADIGLMFRTVLDRYIAETASPRIGYDAADIPNTSTTAEYSFEQKTYREALDSLKQMAPVGTFYYVNSDGRVKFSQRPTTPTHRFVFGRHFESVHVEGSMEKVRNVLLVWNGEPSAPAAVYKHYEDSDSIGQYGRRTETLNDYGIDSSAAADLIATKFLAENKDPEVKVVCRIVDNNGGSGKGYDIEKIQPGDTCSFHGFAPGLADVFRDNMLITRVSYAPDYADVEVEVVKSGLLDFQSQQGKKLEDLGSSGVPETYS